VLRKTVEVVKEAKLRKIYASDSKLRVLSTNLTSLTLCDFSNLDTVMSRTRHGVCK
jgi:hypothetical protein